jgi:hypothetical protein
MTQRANNGHGSAGRSLEQIRRVAWTRGRVAHGS